MKVIQKAKGFTFIELIIGMAIIALLIALGILGINTAQRATRDAERLKKLEEISLNIQEIYGIERALPSWAIQNGGTQIVLTRGSSVRTINLTKHLVSKVGYIENEVSDVNSTVYCYVQSSGGNYELSANFEGTGWSGRQLGTRNGWPCSAGWPPNAN